MPERSWLSLVQQQRVIAVIRSPQHHCAQSMAKAVAAGDIRLIEIAWNSDCPAEVISTLRSALPQCTVGTGTILDLSQARQAIAAGAQFLFTPHTDPALIHLAVDQGIPVIPGALSPTEIVTAWQAGASSVKVFPIEAVGGASYIQSLQGPLGHIPLIPTGGVTLANAADFLRAGAVGVGLSGQLFPSQAIATENWSAISERARSLRRSLSPDNPG